MLHVECLRGGAIELTIRRCARPGNALLRPRKTDAKRRCGSLGGCPRITPMRRNVRTGGFEDVGAYSRAVRVGAHIVVSATAPTGDDGAALHPGDTFAQTQLALERASDAVRELGGSLQDVVRTRVYLTRDSDWREAIRAHAEIFTGIFPANTTYYVEGFIPPGVLVEVELDAIVDD
jgi:enamine deaminase RidA (YjgF/YER057c/UK114 family)